MEFPFRKGRETWRRTGFKAAAKGASAFFSIRELRAVRACQDPRKSTITPKGEEKKKVGYGSSQGAQRRKKPQK